MSYINSQFFSNQQIWVYLKIEHLARCMKVDKDIEIQVLRLQIADKFKIQPERLRICYEGKVLRDMDTLEDVGIGEYHTLQVDVNGPISCAATLSRLDGKGFGFNMPGIDDIFNDDITDQLLSLDGLIQRTERLRAFVNQTNFQYIVNYSYFFYEWIMSDSRLHVMLATDPLITNLMKNSNSLKKLVDEACRTDLLEEMRNNNGFSYRDGAGDSLSTNSNDISLSTDLRGVLISDKESYVDGNATYVKNSSDDTEEQSSASASGNDNGDAAIGPYPDTDKLFNNIVENQDKLLKFIHSKPIRFCLDNLAKDADFIDFVLNYNEEDAGMAQPSWIVNLTKSFTDLEYN